MSEHRPLSALEANLRLVIHHIGRIQEEIKQRKALSRNLLSRLQSQLETYVSAKNDRNALLDHSSGQGYLKDREHVNQLIRETKHHIATEERACFNDLQKLEWERRQLEREQAQLEHNIHLMKRKSAGDAP
jgi:hypothetical protein